MGLEEIRRLGNERKWMQFCEAIIECTEVAPEQLAEMFLECAVQMHPRSSCAVFVELSGRLPPEDGVRFLDAGLEAICNTVMYSEEFIAEKVLIGMRKCLLLVGMGIEKGVERQLLGWRNVRMSKEMRAVYHMLGFKLYERMGNVEEALFHLLKHVELCPGGEMMDILVEYTILSRNFFDFTSVILHPGFEEMRSRELKSVFVMLKEGDVVGIERCGDVLVKMFGKRADAVREKAYITALLDLCLMEGEKQISIEKIGEALRISRDACMSLILRSFGLCLMDGWVDGENMILYFNSISPRTLQREGISKIRDRLRVWEERVKEVVLMLGN